MDMDRKNGKNWKIFIPHVFLLTGIFILILLIIQPYKYFGVYLSSL